MNPSRAMGTFLRVWRSEWAGLSRAQLAIAISTQLPKRKAVTIKAIRRWEEGHPPNSTEKLEALSKVMRRYALTRPEVEQFRRGVFSACIGRQYPGLWVREELAHRPNVDEIAYGIWGPYIEGTQYPLPADMVEVTALLHELERALSGACGSVSGSRQVRKQRTAACLLRQVVMHMHGHGGRSRVMAACAEANAAELRTYFGMNGLGLGETTTVLAQYSYAAQARIQPGEPAPIHRLIHVSEQAEARGEGSVALGTFAAGLWFSSLYAPLLYARVRPRAEPLLAKWGEQIHPWGMFDWHYNCACAASVEGAWDRAEAHLTETQRYLVERGGGAYGQLGCEWAHALLCLRRGDLSEGLAMCERALELADSVSLAGWASVFRTELERSDRRHWARRASA